MYECATCSSDNACDTCVPDFKSCSTRCYVDDATAKAAAGTTGGLPEVFDDTSKCTACTDGMNCKDCSSLTVCTQCYNGFVLFEDTTASTTSCIPRSECEDKVGYYAESDANLNTNNYSDTKKCLVCDASSNCFNCRDTALKCTSCADTYILVLSDNTCVSASTGCPEGTFLSGNICVECHPGCVACNGDSP